VDLQPLPVDIRPSKGANIAVKVMRSSDSSQSPPTIEDPIFATGCRTKTFIQDFSLSSSIAFGLSEAASIRRGSVEARVYRKTDAIDTCTNEYGFFWLHAAPIDLQAIDLIGEESIESDLFKTLPPAVSFIKDSELPTGDKSEFDVQSATIVVGDPGFDSGGGSNRDTGRIAVVDL